eukprot:3940942-Rhodomonas_salina.2
MHEFGIPRADGFIVLDTRALPSFIRQTWPRAGRVVRIIIESWHRACPRRAQATDLRLPACGSLSSLTRKNLRRLRMFSESALSPSRPPRTTGPAQASHVELEVAQPANSHRKLLYSTGLCSTTWQTKLAGEGKFKLSKVTILAQAGTGIRNSRLMRLHQPSGKTTTTGTTAHLASGHGRRPTRWYQKILRILDNGS